MPPFIAKVIPKLLGYTALVACIFIAGASWQKNRDLDNRVLSAQSELTAYKEKVDREIARSQALNAVIEQEIANNELKHRAIEDRVVEHLNGKLGQAQKKILELEKAGYGRTKIVEICSYGDLYRLDSFTVGMLNHASQPANNPEPASGADEEGGTLTDVSAKDLIEHQLKVTRMYNELSIRHNGLVDWITEKQRELAKQ